jgi:hypothetical protein
MSRTRSSNRPPCWLWSVVALSVWLCACGPVGYTASIHSAELKLKQARDENARWYAPYEYYFAEAHLRQSEHDASVAAYEDAVRYAKIAEDYGARALEITRRKRMAEH